MDFSIATEIINVIKAEERDRTDRLQDLDDDCRSSVRCAWNAVDRRLPDLREL
jgi:hypothetical protein